MFAGFSERRCRSTSYSKLPPTGCPRTTAPRSWTRCTTRTTSTFTLPTWLPRLDCRSLSLAIPGKRPQVARRQTGSRGRLLDGTSDQFVAYEQPESFRFLGEQMPQLATSLRAGASAALPRTASSEVDVALARNWTQLWSVGDNVLPLAFRTVNNATDAAINLLLDVVTRARLGMAAYGREGAITKLGFDHEHFQAKQMMWATATSGTPPSGSPRSGRGSAATAPSRTPPRPLRPARHGHRR